METRSASRTLKLKEVSYEKGMFPELQTTISIFEKQFAIATKVPRLQFSKTYFKFKFAWRSNGFARSERSFESSLRMLPLVDVLGL